MGVHLNPNEEEAERVGVTLQLQFTVAERVLALGEQIPDQTAIIADRELTYADLADRVRSFSRKLTALGVRRSDHIGVSLPRSAETLIAVLAIHLCGAAYVPLDPELPADRLRIMAETAGVAFVVVHDETHPAWAEAQRCVSYFAVATSRDEAEPVPPQRSDLAYIIFTSGSTGQPKGVQIDHQNLAALLNGWDHVMRSSVHVDVPRLGSASSPLGASVPDRQTEPGSHVHVSLWLSALSFDASVAEIFWPLHTGGTLVVPPPSSGPAGLGLSLGSLLRTHMVTHLQCTPTRATMLLADENDRAALANIEHFVIGGEALPSGLAENLLNAGVHRLTNAYGPTEATVWATAHEVTRSSLDHAIVSVGHPLVGVHALVLDALGRECPTGVVGELTLAGSFVSRGYIAQPKLSESVFGTRRVGDVDMPSYRTGDLCAREHNGTLRFHGRVDAQVKVRGHRIELGEIEAVLAEHPLVEHAVVDVDRRHVGAGDPAQDLIAAVSLVKPNPQSHTGYPSGEQPEIASDDADSFDKYAPNRILDPALVAELRSFLRSRLPAVMVPRSIVLFRTLPLTSSGKLNRVRVRQTLGGERSREENIAATADLPSLIDDYRAVLPVRYGQTINGTTNFFDAGGHSLLVVELVERIWKRTSIRVPLSAVLRAPTPTLLHELLQQRESAYKPIVQFTASRSSLAESSKRRLYLIHGAGGHVLRFQPLAKRMAADVEIIGVQAIGVEGSEEPDRTLEEMADRYAEAIFTPNHGPYELGGYSDGGIIATHVAQRLCARGAKVRSLIFIDSFKPLPYPEKIIDRLRNAAYNATHRDELPLRQWLHGANNGWKRRADWDVEGVAALKRLGYNDVFDTIETAVRNGAPAPRVEAPALLLRTYTENPIRLRDYTCAYESPIATTVKWVGGKHDELLYESTIDEIATHIQSFLAVH